MTTRIAQNSQVPQPAPDQATASTAAHDPTSPLSGAVPAQQPGRSYASAITATQTPPTPAGASAPAQNAKPVSESPVNGTPQMAQGGPQVVSSVPNGTPSSSEHGRKPSVVISASGASGYTPNGGPVGQSARPPISFGSMNAQGSPLPAASVPYQSQPALSAPQAGSQFIPPAQSPSPIPQPPVSGGHRPPSSLQQSSSNGMTFGSMGGDSEQVSWRARIMVLPFVADSTLDATEPNATRSSEHCDTDARAKTVVTVDARRCERHESQFRSDQRPWPWQRRLWTTGTIW